MIGAYGYKFYVLDLESSLFEWPRFRYDQYNTGAYGSGNLPGIIAPPVDALIVDFGLRVFPNPFVKAINIKFQTNTNSQTSQTTLKIYDVTGRSVKSFSLPTSHFLLPTSMKWAGDDNLGRRVPSGVYFIRLENSSVALRPNKNTTILQTGPPIIIPNIPPKK